MVLPEDVKAKSFQFASGLLKLILFTCCFIFVARKTFICYSKYLDGTRAVKINYQSANKVDFPAITFCGRITSMFKASEYPKPYNIDELNKCNLTWSDYHNEGHWVGKGEEYCLDPEKVAMKALIELEDLDIKSLKFVTFNAKTIYKEFNVSNGLVWEKVYLPQNGRCYTMRIPREIVQLGMYQVDIAYKTKSILDVFVHHYGLLDTDLPGSSPMLNLKGRSVTIPVEHEKIQVIDYAGEECVTDANYQLDSCRQEFIHSQCLKKFGCTTPFGSNLEYICKDPIQSKEAMEFYYQLYNDRFNIPNCSYPCGSLKVKLMNKAGSGIESLSMLPKVTLQFDKFIQVTQSYLAYTQLELIAECGGYVGLFLGISVLHLRLVFDMILQFILHKP